MNLTALTATELAGLVRRREISAFESVRAYLKNIQEQEPRISAFISVLEDEAVHRARMVDRKRKKGLLAGVPLAIKDNIQIKGVRTTCASKMLENFIAPYSATAITRLESEDAIFIGKTNMDEFAMGSSTENSAFSLTKNPWVIDRVPGGSSGGSAAAVAAGEAAAALGSDTGGSVRQPASFCGLVGLKPTYGRISRYGLVAFASSLDQIGPMTRSVEDCALLTKIMAGYDPKDATVSDLPVADYTQEIKASSNRVRLGVLEQRKLEGVDPEVLRLYQETLGILEREGVQIFEMPLPLWDYALCCYYIVAPSEASSNLARFDGVRYGFRHSDSKSLEALYTKTRTEGFGREVRRRILMGTFALSSGYYEAYYSKAIQVRQSIAQEFKEAFERVDFILTPTAPEPAFPIGAKEDPIAMYLSDTFTVVANLAGLPALSLPVGLSQDGLPIGMQIIGNFFQEKALFRLAFLLEKNVRFSKPI